MTSDPKTSHDQEPTFDWAPNNSTEDTTQQPTSTPDSSDAPLRRIGRFDLLELLGKGGMGEVWRAMHVKLQKEAALKLLPPERMTDAESVARFRREIRLTSGLNHPHIARFENAGEEDGVYYLVIEYIRGVSLGQLVKQIGPLPIPDACQVVGQAALGLEHARRMGLIHRDVKPSNLMIDAAGVVKVVDFGLALLTEGGDELTPSGRTLGAVKYMAPEQALASREVDTRADIYSLGCTLFKLLTGRAPFRAADYDSPQKILLAHATQTPPRLSEVRPEVPAKLANVVAKMLAKNPDQRYHTPAEVVEALAPFAVGSDVRSFLKRVEIDPREEAEESSSTHTAEYLQASLLAAVEGKSSPPKRKPRRRRERVSRRRQEGSSRKFPAVLVLVAAALLFGVFLTAVGAWWAYQFALKRPNPRPPLQTMIASAPIVLQWDRLDWPRSFRRRREFAFDDCKVTISLTGDVSLTEERALHGGNNSLEENLLLSMPARSGSQEITAEISFSAPAKDVHFLLLDVDRDGGVERVEVSGFHENLAIAPQLVGGPANSIDAQRGIVSGNSPAPDAGSNSSAGNVQVQFLRTVDRVVIKYTVEADHQATNPSAIALHDVHFTEDKPFGATLNLDWDQHPWRRRFRRHAFDAGGVKIALSLSGDVWAGQSAPKATPLFAGMALGQGGLIWGPGDAQATAITLDFDSPVDELEFSLKSIDSTGRSLEAIRVVGLDRGHRIQPTQKPTGAGAEVRFASPVDRVLLIYEARVGDEESPSVESRERSAHPFFALGDARFRVAANHRPKPSSQITTIVPATANPWLAGRDWRAVLTKAKPAPSAIASAAPGEAPIFVEGLALQAGSIIQFSAEGAIRLDPQAILHDPDGGSRQIRLAGQAATQLIPFGSLVGMFTGNHRSLTTTSAINPKPESELLRRPRLNEVFFIGSGKTAHDELRSYLTPVGAAQLLLGVVDEYDSSGNSGNNSSYDNSGAFEVQIVAKPSSRSPAASVSTTAANLLTRGRPRLDFDRDVIGGRASWEGETLSLESAKNKRMLLQFPLVLPREYVLDMTVERTGGEQSFGVGLSSGRGRFFVLFDFRGTGQATACLTCEQEGERRMLAQAQEETLRKGNSVDLSVAVAADDVKVKHNGRSLLEWKGDPQKLSLSAGDDAFYPGILFLHNFRSSFRIHQFRLTSRSGYPKWIGCSGPHAPPDRRAAELALWKGGTIEVAAGRQKTQELDRLEDIPPNVRLLGVGAKRGRDAALGDSDAPRLLGAQFLQKLNLSRSQITNEFLAQLAESMAQNAAARKNLTSLLLSSTDVTDEGLAHLSRFRQLDTLFLAGTKVTSDGLVHLRHLSGLKRVGLSTTKVSDEGVKLLCRNSPHIEWLCLCYTETTKHSLPHLAKLGNLRTLHLARVPLTDDDLAPLYTMDQLREIRLADTDVTSAGKKTLGDHLPKLSIQMK